MRKYEVPGNPDVKKKSLQRKVRVKLKKEGKTHEYSKVRDIEIGAGAPKIIVPIVGVTKNDIIEEAKPSIRFRLML